MAAAVDAERALGDGQIRVRIGIHTGEPVVMTDEGYVGMDVRRAARIAAAGHGGHWEYFCGLLFSPHERTRHAHEEVTTT